MAERARFELALGFLLNSISNAAPSTARPSLRKWVYRNIYHFLEKSSGFLKKYGIFHFLFIDIPRFRWLLFLLRWSCGGQAEQPRSNYHFHLICNLFSAKFYRTFGITSLFCIFSKEPSKNSVILYSPWIFMGYLCFLFVKNLRYPTSSCINLYCRTIFKKSLEFYL